MKKIYMKPAMSVETFSLSQTIANGCGVGSNAYATLADRGSCGWNDGADIVWVTKETGCNECVDVNLPVNGFCYDAPTGNQIFAS